MDRNAGAASATDRTILRAVLIYVAVVILIRLMGKRGLSEMNTFDVIVALLLAEILGGAIMGEDASLTGGLVAALTFVALNVGFNHLVHRFPTASRVLQGKPTTVVRDGQMAEGALQKLNISSSELDHAIRSQHGDDISEVDHAELTPSGKLVLTLKYEEQSATKADIAAVSAELQELKSLLSARQARPSDE